MRRGLWITVLILASSMLAAAQGIGFSFQGRLNDGNTPANGAYDLQFRLYDAIAGGNQIGSMVDRPNTVLANGVFSVTLDFGAAAFNNPASVFIEIAVKPNGSPNAYNFLGPRQQLTVVPYAIKAANADNATNANHAVLADHSASTDIATFAYDATNAVNATNSTTAATSTNALNFGGTAPAGYVRLNTPFNTGDLELGGDFVITGNIRQLGRLGSNPRTFGAIKAMAFVKVERPAGGIPSATVDRCYNGITGESVAPCGIQITSIDIFDGVSIQFDAIISNGFISLTSTATTDAKVDDFVNSTTVHIFDGGGSTRFYIFVY